MREWVSLPTSWIEEGGLEEFTWGSEGGSDNTAALMVLMVVAHHAERETGVARVTYDEMADRTSLSRTKISAALNLLSERSIIGPIRQSTYRLCRYSLSGGWGKLPAVGLYRNGRIVAFNEFHLRNRTELDALKLYFLFVARRDNRTNMAHITYEQIEDRSGVARYNIKSALSLLAANALVHVEHIPSQFDEGITSNAYRFPQLNSYIHMATRGRTNPGLID